MPNPTTSTTARATGGAPHNLETILSDGFRMGVRVRYQNALHGKNAYCVFREGARNVSAAWFPALKLWLFTRSDAEQLLFKLSRKYPHWFPAWEIRTQWDAALHTATPFLFASALDVRIGVTAETPPQTVLHGQYDKTIAGALRKLDGAWIKGIGLWKIPHPARAVVQQLERHAGINPANLAWLPEPVHLGRAEKAGAVGYGFFDLGECTEFVPPESPPPESGILVALGQPLSPMPVEEGALHRIGAQMQLMDHQYPGARHLLQFNAALLADDMGMGKTAQAIAAGRVLLESGGRALVLCPATLRNNWKLELEKFGVDPQHIHLWESQRRPDDTIRWVIIHYEMLDSLVQSGLLDWEVLIIDEAHYLKDPKAKRTQNAFWIGANIPRKFLLTGTPLLNRVEELHTLLQLSGHPLGALPVLEFRDAFTLSRKARRLLTERIDEWMLRRRKDHCLNQPEKVLLEPLLNLSDSAMHDYWKVYRNPEISTLEKLGQLRHLVETLKLPFIEETLLGLDVPLKAVVFCEYKESVRHLRRILEQAGQVPVMVTGDESMRQRNQAIQLFQDDPDTRFILVTTATGGVGLNLIMASYVLFASRPWTDAAQQQAIDRAHRIGQTRQLMVINPVLAGTIDEGLQALVQEKAQLTAEVVDGGNLQELLEGADAAQVRQKLAHWMQNQTPTA